MPAATTTVVYIGGHDVVEIEIAPGVWRDVEQGASIDVPAALAASLLEQVDVWAKREKKAPAKKAAATKKAAVKDDPPADPESPPTE